MLFLTHKLNLRIVALRTYPGPTAFPTARGAVRTGHMANFAIRPQCARGKFSNKQQ